jgi:hypothetical protein
VLHVHIKEIHQQFRKGTVSFWKLLAEVIKSWFKVWGYVFQMKSCVLKGFLKSITDIPDGFNKGFTRDFNFTS